MPLAIGKLRVTLAVGNSTNLFVIRAPRLTKDEPFRELAYLCRLTRLELDRLKLKQFRCGANHTKETPVINIRMIKLVFVMCLACVIFTTLVLGQILQIPRDPGVRGGAPGGGQPLP